MTKQDYRDKYDLEFIRLFREKYPEEIKFITKEILKKKPKISKTLLQSLIDNWIMPRVINRPEKDKTFGGNNVISLSCVSEGEIVEKIS